MNTELPEIDYDWCDQCLTNCEAIQAQLTHQQNRWRNLIVSLVISLLGLAVLAYLGYWVAVFIVGWLAMVSAIAALRQRESTKQTQAEFEVSGQCVESVREILFTLRHSKKITPQQCETLKNRVGKLPISPMLNFIHDR